MSRVTLEVGDHEGSILRTGRKYTPKHFDRKVMPTELSGFATRMAMETFASMINSGHSFQAALKAVFLTGVDAGMSSARETEDEV